MMSKEKDVTQAEINIGLVGHVDHGKTTITKTLTGKWVDTHSEELKRGISIRLGYADQTFRICEKCDKPQAYTIEKKCKHCKGEAKVLRKVSFIDAPGHETLMTTMLSGAALMDGAILVIAANETCPQPQTIEHLTAFRLGGVKNIIVAQNKIDLVSPERAKESFEEIKKFLEKYGYKDVPIIPTAAHFGTNIDALIQAIEEFFPTPDHDKSKPLKAYIVRSFDINKPGSKIEDLRGGILGGSIIQGVAKIGDTIEITPGIDGKPIEVEIKSLSAEAGKLNEAHAGGLIAFGTLLDPDMTKGDKMKGQIIATKGSLPKPTNVIDLEIHDISGITDKFDPMKQNEIVVLTVGTATTVGPVQKIKNNVATVASKTMIVAEKGQRIAISRRVKTGWRLASYGIVK